MRSSLSSFFGYEKVFLKNFNEILDKTAYYAPDVTEKFKKKFNIETCIFFNIGYLMKLSMRDSPENISVLQRIIKKSGYRENAEEYVAGTWRDSELKSFYFHKPADDKNNMWLLLYEMCMLTQTDFSDKIYMPYCSMIMSVLGADFNPSYEGAAYNYLSFLPSYMERGFEEDLDDNENEAKNIIKAEGYGGTCMDSAEEPGKTEISYGYDVKNLTSDLILEDVKLVSSVFDKAGRQIANKEEIIPRLYPKEVLHYCACARTDKSDVGGIFASVSAQKKTEIKNFRESDEGFTLRDVKIENSDNECHVSGKIVNNTGYPYSRLTVFLQLRRGDKIVGGKSLTLLFSNSMEEDPFDLTLPLTINADNIKISWTIQ